MPKPEWLDVFEMDVNKQYGLSGWLLSTWETRRWPVTGYGEGFEGFKDSFCSPKELPPGSRAGMEGMWLAVPWEASLCGVRRRCRGGSLEPRVSAAPGL